jgi:hypothetical protein
MQDRAAQLTGKPARLLLSQVRLFHTSWLGDCGANQTKVSLRQAGY